MDMNTFCRKRCVMAAAVLCMGAAVFFTGCGSSAQPRSSAVSVKAMKVIQQDTSVSHDYSGQVKSMDAVVIKPKVSGSITEKYLKAVIWSMRGRRCTRSMTGSMSRRCFLPVPMWRRPGRR